MKVMGFSLSITSGLTGKSKTLAPTGDDVN